MHYQFSLFFLLSAIFILVALAAGAFVVGWAFRRGWDRGDSKKPPQA